MRNFGSIAQVTLLEREALIARQLCARFSQLAMGTCGTYFFAAHF